MVFKIKGFIISSLSPMGHKLGSHHNRMAKKMKRDQRQRVKVRIMDVTGDADLGSLAFG